MSTKLLIALIVLAIIGTGFTAYGKTLYLYNSKTELCGVIGKGSYWSAYDSYPSEPAHWARYFKMHINYRINIASDRSPYVPAENDVSLVVLRPKTQRIAAAVAAHLGDNVCLEGHLYPLLAGRWLGSIAESVSFTVSSFAPTGNRSVQRGK